MWKGTHTGAVNGELQPVGSIGKAHGGSQVLWEGPHTRRGEKCEESPPPGEEGAAETTAMNCSLHFLYLCNTGGEKVERIEIKIKSRKKRVLWERCFTI